MDNLLSVWSTIGSVALAIFILLVMITIHEFGHYIVGKLLKFRIDEFSIGFGPALFKHRNKRTGELFALRLIPLGGYCAFAGEEDEEEQDEGEQEPFPETEPPCERQPAEEGVSASPAPPEEAVTGGKFLTMAPWKRILVLLAGAFMNYLLGLLLILICFASCGQTMVAVYRAEGTEAIPQEYCLRDYDILLAAEGQGLYLTTDLAHILNGKREGDRVSLRVSRVTGEREGRPVREEMDVVVELRCDVAVQNSAELDSVWRAIGVAHVSEGEHSGFQLASASYKFGAGETIGRSFVYSFKIADSIFRILGELFTGKLGISALGGPVTTITLTSQIAAQSFRGALEIAGFLGVNLAIFNLLPLPALDGSKVAFTLIEWVRKKPINRKVEAVIHAVGFLLLFGFAILVDILQFV